MNTARSLYTLMFSLALLVMAAANVNGYTIVSGFMMIEEPFNSSRITIGEEIYEINQTQHPYDGTGIVWEKEFSWQDASYTSVSTLLTSTLPPATLSKLQVLMRNMDTSIRDRGKW